MPNLASWLNTCGVAVSSIDQDHTLITHLTSRTLPTSCTLPTHLTHSTHPKACHYHIWLLTLTKICLGGPEGEVWTTKILIFKFPMKMAVVLCSQACTLAPAPSQQLGLKLVAWSLKMSNTFSKRKKERKWFVSHVSEFYLFHQFYFRLTSYAEKQP